MNYLNSEVGFSAKQISIKPIVGILAMGIAIFISVLIISEVMAGMRDGFGMGRGMSRGIIWTMFLTGLYLTLFNVKNVKNLILFVVINYIAANFICNLILGPPNKGSYYIFVFFEFIPFIAWLLLKFLKEKSKASLYYFILASCIIMSLLKEFIFADHYFLRLQFASTLFILAQNLIAIKLSEKIFLNALSIDFILPESSVLNKVANIFFTNIEEKQTGSEHVTESAM